MDYSNFSKTKNEVKDILRKNCIDPRSYLILDDDKNILSIKVYSDCRRSNAISELSEKFKFTVFVQGYNGYAEGHQPVFVFNKTSSKESWYFPSWK